MPLDRSLLSPVVRAMEVAISGLDGGEGESAGLAERLHKLLRTYLGQWGKGGEEEIDNMLSELLHCVYFTPVVCIEDGRAVGFLPQKVVGVYSSKEEAMAVMEEPLLAFPIPTKIVPVLDVKKSNLMPNLSPQEWGLIAIVISKHFKPLASGSAPTQAADYSLEVPMKLPREALPKGMVLVDKRSDGLMGYLKVSDPAKKEHGRLQHVRLFLLPHREVGDVNRSRCKWCNENRRMICIYEELEELQLRPRGRVIINVALLEE